MLNHPYSLLVRALALVIALAFPAAAQTVVQPYPSFVEWSFVTSGTSTTNAVTIPSTAQPGDLAVWANGANNSDSSAQPGSVDVAGWLTIITTGCTTGSGAAGIKLQVRAKILVSGEPNTAVTGMVDNAVDNVIAIFRPNEPTGTANNLNPGFLTPAFLFADADQTCATNNWAAQTSMNQSADPSTVTIPVITFAAQYAPNNTMVPTDSAGFDGQVANSDDDIEIGYAIYNQGATLEDHSIDGTNGSAANAVSAAALAFTTHGSAIVPRFVAASTGTIAASATESENYPTGTVADDIVILCVANDNLTGQASPGGGGWTSIDSETSGSDVDYGCWWKRSGGETSVSITTNAASISPVQMRTYRGADLVSPINAQSTEASGASLDPNAGSVTPTVNGTMIVAIGFVDDDNVTSLTCGVPMGNGSFIAAGDSAGSTASIVSCDYPMALATAFDSPVFTDDGDDAWRAIAIAIKGR